ncbi:hypothetical protein [Dyella sp. 2RAB6]|uniref:hypothetical protein n=1 Tax=Dyella sp. 2RAB6 TaxID=3232992 RepID=UPI003F8ECB18
MNTRRRIVALLVSTAMAALTWSGSAAAQDANGLGSSWPSAADASRSASFHAYRWVRNGVSYVQVNDRNGAPLVALAAAGGTVIVLPIGSAAVKIVLPSPSVAGAPVYTDERVSISNDGSGFTVQSLEAQPCSDPIECAKINSAAPASPPAATLRTMSAQDTCTDPIECAK